MLTSCNCDKVVDRVRKQQNLSKKGQCQSHFVVCLLRLFPLHIRESITLPPLPHKWWQFNKRSPSSSQRPSWQKFPFQPHRNLFFSLSRRMQNVSARPPLKFTFLLSLPFVRPFFFSFPRWNTFQLFHPFHSEVAPLVLSPPFFSDHLGTQLWNFSIPSSIYRAFESFEDNAAQE